ncbi:SOS response-associated peptidase family protein [Sphingobacterium faecium]|uniref:SOS response-associated peptidase family protein n=1 Tax=Sphingobacterium faecium TaxID=34087 RepID=UPI003D36CA1C
MLSDSKSYWHRLKNQRCLIPISGTSEHRKVHGREKKYSNFIGEKGREIFYIPGLYQGHEIVNQDGEIHKIGSFSVLTRKANTVMVQQKTHALIFNTPTRAAMAIRQR